MEFELLAIDRQELLVLADKLEEWSTLLSWSWLISLSRLLIESGSYNDYVQLLDILSGIHMLLIRNKFLNILLL